MKKKILSLIVLLVLIATIFILTGCVNNKNNNEQNVNNQELESDFSDINWAKLYYEDEITHSKNDIDSKWKSNNIKTYFIQTEITQYPVMIQIAEEYGDTTLGKKGVIFISYIDGESHNVNNISYRVGHGIELLYNRELNEYRWYVYTKYDNSDEYLDIAKEIAKNMKIKSNGEVTKKEVYEKYQNEDEKYNQYSFRKDKKDLAENFDSIFIKLENLKLDDADIMKDYTDEKEIENNIKKAAKKFKPQSQLLTAEVKSLVEDKKAVEENSKETTEVVFNEEGIQIGEYSAQYGTYNWEFNTEYKIELNKDKIRQIYADGRAEEFDYKIEDYDFTQDSASYSSVHKAIVMYKDGAVWEAFYLDKNNHLTDEGTGQYELATTQANSAENNLLEEYIVLKDYKLHNGLYVTLPTIETLAISSTSGKYRISNEIGTFSINENQINLENGMILTVTADNKFTYNGKTYTLDKEY